MALIFGLFARPAFMELLDAGQEWSIKREEFKSALQERVAKTLMIHSPKRCFIRAMPRPDIHAILAPEGHMDFAKYFQRDPGVCGGETVVTGTRVTLRTVLASLAEGSSFDEILKDYPSLSEDQLRAVVAFAAATAKEDLPLLPVPTLD